MGDGGSDVVAPLSEDPATVDLWTRAAEGERGDVERLAAREGSDRLIEEAARRPRRLTALRALAFGADFTPLPFLADVAISGTDEEAAAALESVAELAARPRMATDPEDALEAHEGCARLLVLARDPARQRPRRVLAVRALRLLADRGLTPAADVPKGLDARLDADLDASLMLGDARRAMR